MNVIGKYFRYKSNIDSFELTGKRPGNQNLESVQQKIAQRLNQMIDDNPELELTELQEFFVKEIAKKGKVKLQKNKIDIAHHIAISAIMDRIVEMMNNPSDIDDENIEALVEIIISSDSPNSKVKVREFFDLLQDNTVDADEKILAADKVVERLNRASPNLISGHRSTNRSVGKNKDPHYVIYNGRFVSTARSVKIGEAFDMFGIYTAKSRVNSQGIIEYQSSSVGNTPNDAYAEYDMFLTPSASEDTSSEDSESYYSPALS